MYLTSWLHTVWQRRELLQLLSSRDILQRYRGSLGGLLWALLTPLLLLSVYTAVFSGIFQARWGDSSDPLEFALQLFVGLSVHGLMADCFSRAPALLIHNSNYVKRVVFPLPLLPLSTVVAALFNFLLSVAVLVVFYIAIQHAVPWGVLWLPVIVLPYALLLLGGCDVLAAVGVYVRDIAQVMSLVITILLFASPVFYPASMLPPALQGVFQLNPLTVIIEQLRATILHQQLPDWGVLALYSVVAVALLQLGVWVFAQLSKEAADVL